MSQAECVFCREPGGELVWSDEFLRIVMPDERDLPGLVRVILQAHCRETTDLPAHERARTMHAVWVAEAAVREVLAPYKMNVASLGNQVPHLHWHVVPRWLDDPWFPAPIWAARRPLEEEAQEEARGALARRSAEVAARRPMLQAAIVGRMREGG